MLKPVGARVGFHGFHVNHKATSDSNWANLGSRVHDGPIVFICLDTWALIIRDIVKKPLPWLNYYLLKSQISLFHCSCQDKLAKLVHPQRLMEQAGFEKFLGHIPTDSGGYSTDGLVDLSNHTLTLTTQVVTPTTTVAHFAQYTKELNTTRSFYLGRRLAINARLRQ